jgi:hypothetical protein
MGALNDALLSLCEHIVLANEEISHLQPCIGQV